MPTYRVEFQRGVRELEHFSIDVGAQDPEDLKQRLQAMTGEDIESLHDGYLKVDVLEYDDWVAAEWEEVTYGSPGDPDPA